MPKFVIERQYLVPMYQHIVVEAENLEEVPSTMWRTSCLSRRAAPSTAVEGLAASGASRSEDDIQ